MAMDRVTITGGFFEFGELIKKWAKDPGTRPATRDAFVNQCSDVAIQIPDYVKAVIFVQHQKEVLTVHLPPADLLADAEEQLETGVPYPLPTFYMKKLEEAARANGPGCADCELPATLTFPNTPDGKKKRKEFHSERIGDYCISLCV